MLFVANVMNLGPSATILLATGMVVASVGAFALIRRRNTDAAIDRALFAQVSVPIGHRERKLLRAMADAAGLEYASSLVMSRGCFDQAAQVFTIERGDSPAVDELRAMLFGG